MNAHLETFFSREISVVERDPGLPDALEAVTRGLESGDIRAALPVEGAEGASGGGWRAVAWVKSAILIGFRTTSIVRMPGGLDRAAFPPRTLEVADGIRLVPGGSAVRRGAHVAAGVVIMPPAYINVGAFVDADTMVDSHALVGSCAQIGEGVHLSAGVQVGGVLEPPGALPVVVEDHAFLGAQSGVFEGVQVEAGAVLAPGVQLTRATTLFDLPNARTWSGRVPAGAVVVPGSRPAAGRFAADHGLSVYAPVIVKYRDASTDAATVLEEALR